MKKLKTIIPVFVACAILLIAACKKDNPTTTEPPKTLTKSFLYDKKWQTKGNTIGHYFKNNGDYGQTVKIGTWKWLNNSDTLEIKYSSGGSIETWHVKWSTEHEFNARLTGKLSDDLFKDQAW